MNRVTLAKIRILVHDDNCWTALSIDESSNESQRKILNETLTDASDIDIIK